MRTPDASQFTRRKRDLAMTNGVPINPIKNRASAFFFRPAGAVSLPNFLGSPRKNYQPPALDSNIITLGNSLVMICEINIEYDDITSYISKFPVFFTAPTTGSYLLDYDETQILLVKVLPSTTPQTFVTDIGKESYLSPTRSIQLTAGQVLAFMSQNTRRTGQGARSSVSITKQNEVSRFTMKADTKIALNGDYYLSNSQYSFIAPESGAYTVEYGNVNGEVYQVLQTTTPNSFISDDPDTIISGNGVYLTSGQVLRLMFGSEDEDDEITVSLIKQPPFTGSLKVDREVFIPINRSVPGETFYTIDNPIVFEAPETGFYATSKGVSNTIVFVGQNTTPATLVADTTETVTAGWETQPKSLNQGQKIYIMPKGTNGEILTISILRSFTGA
jgi:hypothetical protein